MIKLNYILLLVFIVILSNCSENNDVKNLDIINERCPCDSSGSYIEKGRDVHFYYIGKSQIETTDISANRGSDTLVICRYIKIDSINKWRMQEMVGIAKGKFLPSNKAFYCDFKEEKEGYRITFIRTEDSNLSKADLFIKEVIGSAAIFGKDTIHSKDSSVVIPKEKFKGIVQIDKIMNAVYKGEKTTYTGHMLIEAENMIKYGNLLEQYKAITKLCNKNKAAKGS